MRVIRTPRAAEQTITTQTTPNPATRRVGRVTIRRAITIQDNDKKAAEADINSHLGEMLANIRAIEELAAINEGHSAAIEKLLKDHGMPGYTNGLMSAEFKDSYSKEMKSIDPKVYFDKVSREDFFKSVKVQITEVKKFLTEAEIIKISKRTPSVKTGTALVISKVERKVK